MIYLDNAATSLKKPNGVAEAMARALGGAANAGRGGYGAATDAAMEMYRCREKLAALFRVPGGAAQVVFAAGATAALNTALHGLLRPGDHVITTAMCHNSVLRPLYVQEAAGVELTILPADSRGRVKPEQFEAALRPNTKVLAMTHASNLCGNVYDPAPVAAIAHAHGALLVLDAAQTAGVLPIDMAAMGIDVLCCSAHKGLLGPQGLGVLCVRQGVEVQPLLYGGTGVHSFEHSMPAAMPDRLEAGTQNLPGIAGLSAALDWLVAQDAAALLRHSQALARRFYLGVYDLPGLRFYGDYSDFSRRTPVLALNLEGVDSAALADALWRECEICVRAGTHCAPLAHKTFGTEDTGAVRFSFSAQNNDAEVRTAVLAVRALAEQ